MRNLIEIVHKVSSKLSDIKEEEYVYEVLYDGLKEMFQDTYFLISKVDPVKNCFRVSHSYGFEKYMGSIKLLLGKDLSEMEFPVDDITDDKREDFEERNLIHFEDGIYSLVYGRINKFICRAIEKVVGVKDIYAISLCLDGRHFAAINLFIPSSKANEDVVNKEVTYALESIAFQASSVIYRLRDFKELVKKKGELVLAQARYNQLVSKLDDIVWKANGDGTGYVDMNNSFVKYYGYSEAEFNANPNLWLDIVHPDDKEIAQKAYEDLIKNGIAEAEYRIVRSDGKTIWVHDRTSAIFDQEGKPVQLGGVVSEITEKKILEEQLRLKDYAYRNSPSATAFADLKGYIIYANKAYVDMFGYADESEIKGKHISAFSTRGDKVKSIIQSIQKGDIFVGNVEPKRKDNSTFHSLISASQVMHNNKPICLMAVLVDVTELKQMQASLLKLNREKDKFFAIIAHDLKSPFNSMLGLLQMLNEDYDSYEDNRRRTLINAAYNAANKSFKLLMDLLQWAKLQNKNEELVKHIVDLNTIIDENIALKRSDAQIKSISVLNKTSGTLNLNIDVNSIQTIIRNLISNAVKFTPEGGEIELKAEHINGHVHLSVSDTGIGMSKDTISRLFKLDENISKPGTNNEAGTGLGLIICHEIVTKNNWEIQVNSQIGKGSTFDILIPSNETAH